MTKYLTRREMKCNAGRYGLIHSRDMGFAEEAAIAAKLMAGLPEPFSRGSAAHVGQVMLATAALALGALELLPKHSGGVTPGACEAAAMKLEPLIEGLDLGILRKALLLISGAARTMKNPLDPNANHQWGLWQFGYDGHPLTREAAQKLGILRRFELVSSDFAALMHRAYCAAVGCGPAYTGWTARMPILLCDLAQPLHVDMARAMATAARGELVILSKDIPAEARRRLPPLASLVAEDAAGILTGIYARNGSAFLIERRMEGWTASIPAGAVEKKALTDPKLPKHWRLFARCTEEAAAAHRAWIAQKTAAGDESVPETPAEAAA